MAAQRVARTVPPQPEAGVVGLQPAPPLPSRSERPPSPLPRAQQLLHLQRSAGNRAVVRLVGRTSADRATIQRKLTVKKTLILQNNLKEQLAQDRTPTPDTTAHKFQDWTNDSEERTFDSWDAARAEAAGEVAVDQVVYTALLNLAVAGPEKLVREGAQGEGPDNARAVIGAILAVQQRYRAACHPAKNNIFRFAGHDFFVDHEANYIYPRNEVNKQGVLKDKPTWARDRKLGAKFSYPEHQLPRETVLDIINALATGSEAEIAAGEDLLCVFLASFVAEPGRNPVATITNLMIYGGFLDSGRRRTAENDVFDVMPMTKGGTAKPNEKLGTYDQAMANLRAGDTGIIVPPKASSEEIRMVRQALGSKAIAQLATMVKSGKAKEATEVLQQRLRSLIAAGAGTFGQGIPEAAKGKRPPKGTSTAKKDLDIGSVTAEGSVPPVVSPEEHPTKSAQEDLATDSPSNLDRADAAPQRRGGDCLYDAVNDALGNQYDNVVSYRDIAHAWFLQNLHIYPDLVAVADFDEIVRTLNTRGAWTGDAGDLSPLILASSLGITLEIVAAGATHIYEPLGGNPVRTVQVFYAADHYTDGPTPAHAGWDEQKRVVHRGQPAKSTTPPPEDAGREGQQPIPSSMPLDSVPLDSSPREEGARYRPPVFFGIAEIPERFGVQMKELKQDQVYQERDSPTRYRYLGTRQSVFTLKTHAFERVDETV